ncbi:hypothetical protein CJO66_16165 [Burkholderia ubonensis]|nr:hypothetical protein [Burkholderia ubonensis]PAK13780.1 hypothetical protein CJO66_16165 [Burkholderia ubonensis]RQP90410.1 hypothetical protein DF009_27000 [Burkholderia ubonensis]
MNRDALLDGEYVATCRERNPLSAAANGHSLVFPGARVKVKAGWAHFYRDDVEVWNCNAAYAAANFNIQKA